MRLGVTQLETQTTPVELLIDFDHMKIEEEKEETGPKVYDHTKFSPRSILKHKTGRSKAQLPLSQF